METLQIGVSSEIRRNENVVLYPTFGHWDFQHQRWRLTVSGSIYEPGPDNLRKRMFLRILKRLLKASPTELQSELFQHRLRGFLILTEKGKTVVVRLGDRSEVLRRKSRRNGHFRGSVLLGDAEANVLADQGVLNQGWLDLCVVPPVDDSRKFTGRVQLIGETGLSVISDIDDTIKISEVGHRRRLLRNTFLRQFRPVPGMSDLYRGWADLGAAFHYVSSSPWQLYSCLARLIDDAGFPTGSFHLRSVRFRDPSVLRLFIARRRSKWTEIRSIIRAFPERRFILIGDSGERDPEIYGSVARQFPGQIERILIRKIRGKPFTRERSARAFRNLSDSQWQIFHRPSEVTDSVGSVYAEG